MSLLKTMGIAGVLIGLVGCGTTAPSFQRDYREEMRDFVQGLSAYAREVRPDFVVIPQNGHELLLEGTGPDRAPAQGYLDAIDGVGQESLFYGYDGDDLATSAPARDYTISLLNVARDNGVRVLGIDYCSTPAFVDDSYRRQHERGYISFAADHRALDDIPAYPARPFLAGDADVRSLGEARNFLCIINPGRFADRQAFLEAVRGTDYDLVIVDLFYGRTELTAADVSSLKTKANGGSRLAVAYMSIGEAEDYRYYWQVSWAMSPPAWLAEQNPNWPGNYKVRYWDREWQNLIYGSPDAYLKKILDAGFDGVYLDIIDAFDYFERRGE